MKKVPVAVLATLDSKHEAARFVCDTLKEAGVAPWLVDLSLRPHRHEFADVNGGAVAEAAVARVRPSTAWDAARVPG